MAFDILRHRKIMNNPKISVIVPVYNAEKYLHRCVDSILAQTFPDFELLLIDDGSMDKSGEICDDYGEKDERVSVFHKLNGGVSSARNLGLDKAKGEWITFIDADDYVSVDYFDSIAEQSADLIVLHNRIIYEDGSSHEEAIPTQNIFGKDKVNEFLKRNLLFMIMRAPWGKLFRHSLIGNIRFDNTLRLGEDTVWVNHYLRNCNSISVSEVGTYFYFETNISFYDKYSMSAQECKEHLKSLIMSFRELNIEYPQYEMFLFKLIFPLCWKNMVGMSMVWFRDKFILNMIGSLRPYFRKKEYIKYQLMRIPWFSDWYFKTKI